MTGLVRQAVLLMAYGTPRHPEQLEAYYTDIRRGRPPSAQELADLAARYEAIGGTSPLAERTEAQRAGLQAALDQQAPGHFEVVLGLKHAEPRIEDAVAEIAQRGLRRLVAVVLAPHYSARSVGEYLERARAAADAHGLEVRAVERWGGLPAYVRFLADAVRAGLAQLPDATKVVFTAHSLPERILVEGDPYPDEVRATAAAVAAEVGLNPWAGWGVAWQSAGRTADRWLGPDLLTVIDDLAATGRARGVLVCPCGFVADHLEVLYDLDIEARQRAEAVGLAFARTAVMNDDPPVLAALAADVVAAAAR